VVDPDANRAPALAVDVERHGDVGDDLARVAHVGLAQYAAFVLGGTETYPIVEQAFVAAVRYVVRRIAGGRARINAVVRRGIAIAVADERVGAAGQLFERVVDDAGDRFVDCTIVRGVITRRVAAGDACVGVVEDVVTLRLCLAQHANGGLARGFKQRHEGIEGRVAGAQGGQIGRAHV